MKTRILIEAFTLMAVHIYSSCSQISNALNRSSLDEFYIRTSKERLMPEYMSFSDNHRITDKFHLARPHSTVSEKSSKTLYSRAPSYVPSNRIPSRDQYLFRARRQSSSSNFKKRMVHPDTTTDTSLEDLIKTILIKEMNDCELIIAIDGAFQQSRVLELLVDVPVLKQVVLLVSSEDLAHRVEWKSKNCQGTFLLLSNVEPLIDFGNKYKFEWAYNAKVVIMGLNVQSLTMFAETMKGKKTEHMIGVVQSFRDHSQQIFMNLLFWGNGVRHVSSWLGHKFSKEVELFPSKISNLRGGVVKVFMFDWRPMMIILKDSEGKIIGRYGRDVVVVETLSEVFNFSLVYVDIEQDWGQILPNGSFTGLVGYLGRDEGHIGIANLFPSALDDRHKFQDYSSTLTEDRVCFLARVDPPLPRWQNPSLPFQPSTWLALFIGFLLAGPVLYLLATASNKIGGENSRFTTFSESCLASVAIHFEHPLGILPEALGTQIFTVFLLLYSIIFTTGYRANLTAFLTVTRDPKSFETAEELYKSGIPIMSFPWYRTALQYSANQYHRELAKNYILRYTFAEVLDEILAGKTVTINSEKLLISSSALIQTKKGKPLTRILKECLSSYSVGIGYNMNSPLKSKFNRVLSSMFESGLVIKWYQQTNELYWKLEKEKAEAKNYGGDNWYTSTDGVIPLGMDHMQGIFIVYVAGFVISKIIFLLELCLSHCHPEGTVIFIF